MEIIKRPLNYVDKLENRTVNDIELVVIHCTELPDLETAREYGEKIHYPESGTGNSGHFYIDRDGRIEQWVDPLHMAHHVAGMNPNSIGIELVNHGRYPDWFNSRSQIPTEKYPAAQLEALVKLLLQLKQEYSQIDKIAGHEDLDIRMIPADDDPEIKIHRKVDPGPQFPWSKIVQGSGLKRVYKSDLDDG